MVNYWFIDPEKDFTEQRAKRIGASDIPALIPNPLSPTESLAGYGRTPVTVWEEKTGRKARGPAGLPAEMGHYLEDKAAELFIRPIDEQASKEHFLDRGIWDRGGMNVQSTPYMHHVQFYRDGMICHPDVLYDPAKNQNLIATVPGSKFTAHDLKIDMSSPFLVECKSANYFATKRTRKGGGYNFDDLSWQGIPPAHYMQIQFQLALLGVGVAYLALIHNTNQFQVWPVYADKVHQGKLLDIAGRMIEYIRADREPLEWAINADDIIALYPEIGDDFLLLDGDMKEQARQLAGKYREAEDEERRWKDEMEEYRTGLALLLKDFPEIRDEKQTYAKWQIRKGAERVKALARMKKEDPLAYKYLKRKGLLHQSPDSRSVKVVWLPLDDE